MVGGFQNIARPRLAVGPVGLVFLAFAFIAATGCARADWVLSRSKNVNVYTEARREHRYIQEWLELSHLAYSLFFPGVNVGDVDVVWMKSQPGVWTRFYGPFDDPAAGWTLEGLPSEGKIGHEGLIVLERRQISSGMGWAAVRDEGPAKKQMAHLFIHRAVPLAPFWLRVGLARYLEKFRVHRRGETWIICFGSDAFDETPPPGGTGNGRMVTLEAHEIWDGNWYEYDRRRRRWYEHTAYAMVHYLIHGENGTHVSRFPLLLKALAGGATTPDALATAYPHILDDEWDSRLQAHVRPERRKQVKNAFVDMPQGTCQRVPRADWTEVDPQRRRVDQGEIAQMLADLERVDPFRRHAGWWPRDVVEAEAMRRAGDRKAPAATDRNPGKQGAESQKDPPKDDDPTTITVPIP